MTLKDTAQIYLLWAAMSAAFISMATLALNMFVALKEPPKRRAAWVVGIPYIAIVILCMVWGMDGYRASAPLFALPGAAVAYWYWKGDYSARWYASAEHVPDGVATANDDWRLGLLLLAGLLAVAAIKTALRHVGT